MQWSRSTSITNIDLTKQPVYNRPPLKPTHNGLLKTVLLNPRFSPISSIHKLFGSLTPQLCFFSFFFCYISGACTHLLRTKYKSVASPKWRGFSRPPCLFASLNGRAKFCNTWTPKQFISRYIEWQRNTRTEILPMRGRPCMRSAIKRH